MPEQETLLNSFLANTALMNVVSCGVKQYAAITFSTWCEGSFTYELAILAKNSKLYFHIEGISIFDVILIISVIATLIIIAVNGSGRIRYNDIIDAKSKSKNDPQRKRLKPKDILSIRFGASYKKPKSQNAGSDSSGSEDNEEELLSNYQSVGSKN